MFSLGLASEEWLPFEELPSYGFYYQSKVGVDESRLGIRGMFGKKFKLGFISEYVLLDSIYRQSYTEVDLGRRWDFFALGAGYGFSMEWLPGGDLWVRHRYKLGGTFIWKKMYFGAVTSGWADDFGRQHEFLLGGGVRTGEMLDFYGDWDGTQVEIGSSVKFKHCRMSMAYSFPGFGVSLSIRFFLFSWELSGAYRFGGQSLDGFGFDVSKNLSKKTIL